MPAKTCPVRYSLKGDEPHHVMTAQSSLKTHEKNRKGKPMHNYNIIIANQVTIVNQDTQQSAAEKQEIFIDSVVDKWTEHKKQSKRVAEKMKEIGKKERADRMANCADFIEYEHCPECDTYHIKKTYLCRDRFCPVCTWRLSLKRYSNMRAITDTLQVGYPDLKYSLITLTVKNCKASELNSHLKKMNNAWHNVVRRRPIKKELAGWAKSIEVTYNEKEKTVHPHFHVIFAWYNPASEEVINAWIESAKKEGLEANAKAQNAQNLREKEDKGQTMAGAICETFKYAIKSKDLDDMPLNEFRNLVDSLGGKRLISFGGIIKELAAEMKLEMETAEDSDEVIEVCHKCGNSNIEKMLYKWSFAKYERLAGAD